jgi:hypothetical protein
MPDTYRSEFREIWNRLTLISDAASTQNNENNRKISDLNTILLQRIGNIEADIKVIAERQKLVSDTLGILKTSGGADHKETDEKFISLDKKYVSKTEFWPVKAITFTFVSLLSIGLVTAIIRLVLPHADFTP